MNCDLQPKSLFYKFRTEIRYFLSQYPEFFFSQKANLYGFIDRNRMINYDTEIVIEGFPCSANSFAYTAFRLAQDNNVRIAHHMHDPSQLLVAVKANIPAIVLIRSPDEAILSYVIRFSDLQSKEQITKLISCCLMDYIHFYKKIIKYKKSLIVADFPTVISSYDYIIQQVNNMHGTQFEPFYCNDENVKRVFEIIDNRNKQKNGFVDKSSIARPTASKEKRKSEIRNYFNSSKLRSLLASAHDLYYEMIS